MNDRTCTIDGCTGKLDSGGLCKAHWFRRKRGQPMDAPIRRRVPPTGECSVEQCERPAAVKGLCTRHHYLDYAKRKTAERRGQWIHEQGGTCAHCGSDGPFEIDHIDPASKEIEIAALWLRRQVVRDRELSKCQVLCVPCHRDKNASEQPRQHGLANWRRGCRCGICRSAMDRQLDLAKERRKAA